MKAADRYRALCQVGASVGVAPQANLLNVRVADDQGMSYVSDVVNAIDWVISHRTMYNTRVINLSLVQSISEIDERSPASLVRLARLRRDAGVGRGGTAASEEHRSPG